MEKEHKNIKRKKEVARYFNVEVDDAEVKKLKLKKGKKDFSGDVIKVSLHEKPLKWKNKRKHKNLNLNKPDIDQKLLKKHSRGARVDISGVKTDFFKDKLQRKEVYLEYANEQAARTEILLTEESGFLIPDEDERTADYRQAEIVKNVDITAATKHFKLNLDFGPYHLRYTKNGRHLLLGGRMGHIAAFDWVTKKLHCEMNVMEEVADITWLHLETMFACAQKKWTYFYDNKGTEIHCVKKLHHINKLDFLPYHFLIAAASSEGFLTWLDVSIGELVGNHRTKLGDIRIMRHNPYNGVLCVGSGNGIVSMWSPKVREPLAKMLCHSTPMSALAIDPKGMNMVTSGLDRAVKVWDIRNLNGPIDIYKLKMPANEIDVSQKGALAFSMGKFCEIYKTTVIEDKSAPYLRQRADDFIHGLRFCPYEDVLGISTTKGFSSILVPGSGEANYDALEANPFQTKSQRRENEVHALLEKIPPELITLDPNEIAEVDVNALKDKVDAKKELLFLKQPQIDFKSRRKMKGKGGSVKAARNKQIVRGLARKAMASSKKELIEKHKVNDAEDFIPLEPESSSVLDRFKVKKKK